MLRNTRSSSMGLLDGLQTLQGAPAPNVQASSSNPAAATSDPLGQFSSNARGLFGDFGAKLGDTFAPAVDNINETAKSSVTSLRRMMGDESIEDLEAPAQMSYSEELSSIFNLSMMQRIGLFAMCFGTGILLIGVSFTFLPMIVLVPHKFAGAFTMGNLLAILSTWLLVGPKAQLQSMFSPVRALASTVYLVSLFVTLFAAFFGGKLRYIIVLGALVCQVGSCTSFQYSFPYSSFLSFFLFFPPIISNIICSDACEMHSVLVCIILYPIRANDDISVNRACDWVKSSKSQFKIMINRRRRRSRGRSPFLKTQVQLFFKRTSHEQARPSVIHLPFFQLYCIYGVGNIC